MKGQTSILLTATLLAAPALAGQKDAEARIRVVHASPDAPAVDVWVNGQPAFTDLEFGEAAPYAAVPAAEYDVEVVPAGLSAPVVIDLTGANAVNMLYKRDYTAVAVGLLQDQIEPLLLLDDNRSPSQGFARVRFVHASPDAPAVDIAVTGGPVLFENVAFKGVGEYVEVPRGRYDIEVRPAGSTDAVLTVPGVTVENGRTYTIFAMGLLGDDTLAPVVTVDAVAAPGLDKKVIVVRR